MEINHEYSAIVLSNIAKLESVPKLTLLSAEDGHTVQVHQVILAAISEHFAKTSEDGFEIIVEGLSGQRLDELSGFFYTGNLTIDFENVDAYTKFATQFKIPLLQSKCDEFHNRDFTIHNCIDRFVFTEKKEDALKKICESFDCIELTQLLKLEFKVFEEIIKADGNMAEEKIIFERVVDWIEFDEENRAQHVHDLIQAIRLEHIPSELLVGRADAFCVKHGLQDFIKNAAYARLLNPKPFTRFRCGPDHELFETYRDRLDAFHINRYLDSNEECYGKISIPKEFESTEASGHPAAVFLDDKFFLFHQNKDGMGIEEFDLNANTRQSLPIIHQLRRNFSPIVVDDFIYLLGGSDQGALTKCDRFNMKTRKWEACQSMNLARCCYMIAVVDHFIYVGGGIHNVRSDNSIECFDTKTNKWSKKTPAPGNVAALVAVDGSLHAILTTNLILKYDGEKDKWAACNSNVAAGAADICSSSQEAKSDNTILALLPKIAPKIRRNKGKQLQLTLRSRDYYNQYRKRVWSPDWADSFTKKPKLDVPENDAPTAGPSREPSREPVVIASEMQSFQQMFMRQRQMLESAFNQPRQVPGQVPGQVPQQEPRYVYGLEPLHVLGLDPLHVIRRVPQQEPGQAPRPVLRTAPPQIPRQLPRQ